jgi:hypothetical protein
MPISLVVVPVTGIPGAISRAVLRGLTTPLRTLNK